MNGFERHIDNRLWQIKCIREATSSLLEDRNFAWLTFNLESLPCLYIDMAMLKWRTSMDPRPDLHLAYSAYLELKAFHADKTPNRPTRVEWDICTVAFSLLDRSVAFLPLPEEDFDIPGFAQARFLSLLLQGQKPSERHASAVQKTIDERGDQLWVKSFATYLKLLGYTDTVQEIDELVNEAESNYLKRATDRIYQDEHFVRDGGGKENNKLYVDIVLGAILKKIDWTGQSIHKWIW